MKKITVKITHEESTQVEKLFYEYNASLNILSYLMKQKDINEDYLNQYFQKSELYNIELEELKEALGSIKYKPENIKPISYTFDFYNEAIDYEIEG